MQRISALKQEGSFNNKANASRIGRVLSGWHTDPDFTGPYGMPLELRYDSDIPEDVTFVKLVQRFSGDMTPRAMLDELIRVGAVVETDQNWFKAVRREYVPNLLAPNFLERVGSGVHNFATTIETNMQKKAPGKGLFERYVWRPGGIKKSDLPAFDQYIRERGQNLLDEVDNWLSKLEEPDQKDQEDIVNTGLGIYHYVVKEESDKDIDELLDDRSQPKQ